jgi:hypothetical protein
MVIVTPDLYLLRNISAKNLLKKLLGHYADL